MDGSHVEVADKFSWVSGEHDGWDDWNSRIGSGCGQPRCSQYFYHIYISVHFERLAIIKICEQETSHGPS